MKSLKILTIILFLMAARYSFCQHTFSICAVDSVTGEVGSAGASCIGNSVIISDLHPGFGVVHTQASYISLNQAYARSLMNSNVLPWQIIDSLIEFDYFSDPMVRQYGIVQLRNGTPVTAAFTGVNCMDYKNHITGHDYTIQGNILLGQEILDSMETNFLRASGSLACRLMAAMQGAKVVGADTRCTSSGNSSLSSFLRVALPSDAPTAPYINLNVPNGPTGFEPIDSLQNLFNAISNCQPVTVENHVSKNPTDKISITLFSQESRIMISGELPNSYFIELYDSLGKKVFSAHQKQNNTSLSLKHLSSGQYHLSISSNGKILKTQKVILGR